MEDAGKRNGLGNTYQGCLKISGEEAVDWRGRPFSSKKHGGMRAASFVLGLQAFEIMAIAAVGNNLITYLMKDMHFPLPKSANIVTNFVGTIFIIALLGGYLSDSYLGCFWTILIFGFVELSGFLLLSIQAHLPHLKPHPCSGGGNSCEEAKGLRALILFVALYMVAIGSGCIKPNFIAHGADQFDQSTPSQGKKLSTYFNTAYFAFSAGELLALTIVVWIQTNSGMDVGFGVSAAAMAMGLIIMVSGFLYYRNKPPRGSIFTPIAQVFVAAMFKRKQNYPSDPKMLHDIHYYSPPELDTDGMACFSDNFPSRNPRFRFLEKACIRIQLEDAAVKESPWRLCTVSQVEQVKILLSIIPIFSCTIVFNTILAQLQTFSVQQGNSMNTKLADSFHIPPASLQSIPYVMLIFVVPLYDSFFVPFARKLTGHESGISPLQRIGAGLFTATFSMVAAALMEKKRRGEAGSGNIISIFWITPQFVIFGVSEMLTAVGLIEFFYKQSLKGMHAFLTAITYCSYSFGFFFSSLLVSLVNNISSTSPSRKGWLSDNNLNVDRLDLFYWLLAVLSFLNFFNYLFWARWYSLIPQAQNTSKWLESQA